jgi:hypothetical protein
LKYNHSLIKPFRRDHQENNTHTQKNFAMLRGQGGPPRALGQRQKLRHGLTYIPKPSHAGLAAFPSNCRRLAVGGRPGLLAPARARSDDDEPDWDREMSIFRERTMRPNQLATLRELESKVSVGKVCVCALRVACAAFFLDAHEHAHVFCCCCFCL